MRSENLHVCAHCLAAIESREGYQFTRPYYTDEDELEDTICDWCEDDGFDILYEFM